MALRLLGDPPIDIHTGGIDLVFPHHENEIAQSEGATGKEFSRFWVHVEHLLVDNQKMSKSAGNFYSVQDVIDKGFRLSALRYILLSAYYRKQLNFTWTGLEQAEESLRRMTDFLGRVEALTSGGTHTEVDRARRGGGRRVRRGVARRPQHRGRARRDVRSDPRAEYLDGPQAGREGRRAGVITAFNHFDRVLGVLSLRRAEDATPPIPLADIEAAIQARQDARRRRDFGEADRVREDLLAKA